MRALVCTMLMMMINPAMAAPRAPDGGGGGVQKERMAEQIRSRGPAAFLDKPCGMLKGSPIWGGLRAVGQDKAAELTGNGMKLNCGPGNRVDVVVLKVGFEGRMPKGTTWDMKQKTVYKTLKKAGLKDRTTKGVDGKGAFVRLSGNKPVTWRWEDSKGKGNVAKIVIRKG
ncbi:MAG: hypothetical protein ACI9MC_001233 [Kiritimatiellia bacterium]|jgi:hypothetical protein